MTQSQPQLTQEQQTKLKEALEFAQAAAQNLQNADTALDRLQLNLIAAILNFEFALTS